MDGLPGYDSWKQRTPEDEATSRRGFRPPRSETIRADWEIIREGVPLYVEISTEVEEGWATEVTLIQPIGPQLQLTSDESEVALARLQDIWCDMWRDE